MESSTPLTLETAPAVVSRALQAIIDGAKGDDLEDERLDFKEDPVHHGVDKARARKEAEEILAKACVCFANGDAEEAFVVLGVSDKKNGKEALTGTNLEPETLAQRVFQSTEPNLRVEGFQLNVQKVNLLLFRVVRGLTLYTLKNGAASRRESKRCVPMSQAERQDLIAQRANPDFSAKPSSLQVADLDRSSLDLARQLLTAKYQKLGLGQTVPPTDAGLIRELDLFAKTDHTLVRAADILAYRAAADQVTVRILNERVPGAEPEIVNITEPLLLARERVMEFLQQRANREIVRVYSDDGQEVAVPAFPRQAIDEAVSNAFVHRDWSSSRPIVVSLSPVRLQVTSPGSLPIGVDENRLLTTRSVPRNPRLMAALRRLGLVEESSRGFDRMWTAMLDTGRTPPLVEVDEISVTVTLAVGNPEVDFIAALSQLRARFGSDLIDAVNTKLVLWHLYSNPLLTAVTAASLMQVSAAEATQIMDFLSASVVRPVTAGAREWVLSEDAAVLLRKSGAATGQAITVQAWVEDRLRRGQTLTNREVLSQFGAKRTEVTDLFRQLRRLGKAQIDGSGPSRGPGTRWVAGPNLS